MSGTAIRAPSARQATLGLSPPHVAPTRPVRSRRRFGPSESATGRLMVVAGAIAEPSPAEALVTEAPTPQLSRACTSLLPPLGEKVTTLQQVEEGLWLVQQCLLDADPTKDIRNNAFVVQLANGQLLMTSASISLTEESIHLLRSLPGPVSHLVINSSSPEHWLYAADYVRELWPEATVWACPNIEPMSEKYVSIFKTDVWPGIKEALGPQLRLVEHGMCPEEMGGDVTFSVFISTVAPAPSEASPLIHSRRAVVLGDIGAAEMDTALVDRSGDFIKKPVMKLLGIYGRIGAGFMYLPLKDKKVEAQRWRDLVLSKDWDRVLMSHWTPLIPAPEGRRLFEEAYAFLD